MKRVFTLALALLLLTGCGGTQTGSAASSPDDSAVVSGSNDTTADSSSGTLEVDKGMFNVEFIVPAEFIGEDVTQESLDTATEENGFKSATLNEDGSVSYVMTRAQHDKLMSELRSEIDSGLAEMVESGDYPAITKIESNSAYTEFRVYLSSEEVGLSESFSALALYIYGGMYNAFNGETVDDIAVLFINEASGTVIQEGHSKDIGNSLTE